MKIHNLKHVGHLDIPGGGQVSVKDRIAYVGHMEPPIGTSIVDVSNPKTPRILAQLEVPSNTHSHKARGTGHLLVVNYERCIRPRAIARLRATMSFTTVMGFSTSSIATTAWISWSARSN